VGSPRRKDRHESQQSCRGQSRSRELSGEKISQPKRFILAAGALCFLFLALIRYLPLQHSERLAAGYGLLISIAIACFGFFLLRGSHRVSPGKFIKRLLLGMVIRLFLALAAVFLGIAVMHLPAGMLVGSCLLSYVIFTLLEHVYLLPLISRKKIEN
jgi:hypothetical protein